MHVLKRYVQYLLLPYLSVDIILCAIGHGQEELQYVDSNTWTREYSHHEHFSGMFSLSKGLLSQFIKKHLSENCARGQRFYLSFHVLPCRAGGEVIRPLPDDRYPKSYDFHTPRAKLNEILKAMVKTVAAVPSTLYSKLGVTILNLLTKEQFQLVH